MKTFEDYIKIKRDYDIKLAHNYSTQNYTSISLEKAFRMAFNIARAHRTEVKIYLRPTLCKDLLFIQAFTMRPDGDLHDDTQNVPLDYIKQNGVYGCKRNQFNND